jgi:hypothetical protein
VRFDLREDEVSAALSWFRGRPCVRLETPRDDALMKRHLDDSIVIVDTLLTTLLRLLGWVLTSVGFLVGVILGGWGWVALGGLVLVGLSYALAYRRVERIAYRTLGCPIWSLSPACGARPREAVPVSSLIPVRKDLPSMRQT